jgi:hypothetical protein
MRVLTVTALALSMAALAGGASAANWVVATAPSASVALYYDSSSISREGSLAKVWVLYNFNSPYTDRGVTMSSFVELETIDCPAHKFIAVEQETDYSGTWRNGSVVAQHPDWHVVDHAIIPGSANDNIYRAACR